MKQFEDINEYRKYIALQRAIYWKRKIEEEGKKDGIYGYYQHS